MFDGRKRISKEEKRSVEREFREKRREMLDGRRVISREEKRNVGWKKGNFERREEMCFMEEREISRGEKGSVRKKIKKKK